LSGNVEEQVKVCFDFLESKRLLHSEGENVPGRKCFIIGTKTDIALPQAADNLKSRLTRPVEITAISVSDKASLDKMLADIFRLLDIIRVYAKKPGQEPDMTEPFVLPKGSTVMDLTRSIHRELAEKLKTARCWGRGVHNGQNVHRTHILCDKDIIELHFV
jgi:ribosome-interacting GTPase 1